MTSPASEFAHGPTCGAMASSRASAAPVGNLTQPVNALLISSANAKVRIVDFLSRISVCLCLAGVALRLLSLAPFAIGYRQRKGRAERSAKPCPEAPRNARKAGEKGRHHSAPLPRVKFCVRSVMVYPFRG